MEQLRKGYKKTEVGVIPEDWDLKTVEEIFKFYSTSNYSKAEMFFDGEVGCIHYGLIHAIPSTSYSLENGIKYYINPDQAKYEFVKDGDVVMVDASEDLVGINKSVELKNVNGKKYISGLHTYLLRDVNAILAVNFRGQILNSYLIKSQLLRFAVGMKVFGVSKPQLKQIFIPIPPLAEQTAIANALSDVDELIANLEKLIAKKKAIKQGAMQQLLTPKKDWIVKKISEIAEVGRGRVISHKEIDESVDKSYPVYSSQTSNDGIMGYLGTYDFDGEYVTWTTDGVNAGTVFYRSGNFNCTNVCGTLKLKRDNPKFIAVYLNTITSKYVSKNLANPKLMNDVMKKIEVCIPVDVSQQNEIAEAILFFENEISMFEKKLSKYKEMKQGMMQELLTGKTRLI